MLSASRKKFGLFMITPNEIRILSGVETDIWSHSGESSERSL